MRIAILAIYPGQREKLLMEATSLAEGCRLALRIADQFGQPENLDRPKWVRLTLERFSISPDHIHTR